MPSNDSKTPSQDDKRVVEFKTAKKGRDKTKKKSEISASKILTYIILGAVAIALIAGVAIPAFGPKAGGGSLKFGSYDGTPIEFAYGNYFYNQYQNYAQQSRDSSQAAAYQVWLNAYQGTVFHVAIEKMAKQAGLRVTDNAVNQAIIESGLYHKDGVFDPATYEQASNESKKRIQKQISDNLPTQMIFNDLSSLLTSPQELEYIDMLGEKARSFEYVVFDSSLYPDDLTRHYASANASLFTLIDISSITVSDQAAGEALRQEITTGKITFEDAARESSIDAFSDEGGRSGTWYLWEIQETFRESDEVNLLYSTKKGELSPLFASNLGYTFYRVEKEPFMADLNDSDVLKDVKTYIGLGGEMVTPYLAEQAAQFVAAVEGGEDFKREAQKANLEVYTVEPTPPNTGQSSFFIGFSNTDSGGYLSALADDVTAIERLYRGELNSVSQPLESRGAYVVARATAEGGLAEEMRDYVAFLYPYIIQEGIQQDLLQSIFTNDKFEDNFFEAFIANIMGPSLN